MNVVSINQDHFFVDSQKLQLVGEATAKWPGDFDPNGKPLLELSPNIDDDDEGDTPPETPASSPSKNTG